ncbi:hypothetical protein EMIHUDRAFT_354217 [Emiliania huxleyi CCMP1516]|uniref:Uncharacterized protein n=2 Tax=Emiliania huxleyi TaxID=2903 RepID=A0A0D3JNM0_EMIH1|nr:hypothetical protein EMIHUDRAFT_354217 [Emiliania huxleyi CCMP1516]EOD25105.1 hypothetical protein EMIHUDRAFT_354217 [Emiliania huxleyi CCMP1516]|eukprot:XP_005777534.1 hypothetical protein EMIHUDRAFT_354217 [Emiliania huxleyi CCMP1516]
MLLAAQLGPDLPDQCCDHGALGVARLHVVGLRNLAPRGLDAGGGQRRVAGEPRIRAGLVLVLVLAVVLIAAAAAAATAAAAAAAAPGLTCYMGRGDAFCAPIERLRVKCPGPQIAARPRMLL